MRFIDLSTWDRAMHYQAFRNSVQPQYCVTFDLDITNFLPKIKAKGYKVGVISWTSKGGKSRYNSKVVKAKKEWLAMHFPKVTFDEIHIVKYGVNKGHVCANPAGILFDDNESIRDDWRGLAFTPDMIEKVLASL